MPLVKLLLESRRLSCNLPHNQCIFQLGEPASAAAHLPPQKCLCAPVQVAHHARPPFDSLLEERLCFRSFMQHLPQFVHVPASKGRAHVALQEECVPVQVEAPLTAMPQVKLWPLGGAAMAVFWRHTPPKKLLPCSRHSQSHQRLATGCMDA